MSRYSTSFNQSVMAAYKVGNEGAREVGDRFGVDHSTVRKWGALHAAHALAGLEKKFSHYEAGLRHWPCANREADINACTTCLARTACVTWQRDAQT